MSINRLISVIVPAYNCADTIRPTIDSILASGISDYEIILVDDGSSDSTESICDTLSRQYQHINCIHQENAGVSAARNRGIKEAKGEYLWFFDADDSVKEGSFPKVEEILRNQAPDMLVFGIEFDYYHKGRIYRSDEMLPPLEGMKDVVACGSLMYKLFEANSLSALWSRIIKRSVISSMDTLLSEEMFVYEDLEFVLRVWNRCSSIFFYPEAIYKYQQSEDEGNAGRRLKRIPHIPDLIAKISEPLAGEADKDKILLALYLTLAREKINASSKAEIEIICGDFKSWIDEQDLLSQIETREYPLMLYRGEVSRLVAKRNFSKLRHGIANRLKQLIGDFRKW